jgi:hypothetical protein
MITLNPPKYHTLENQILSSNGNREVLATVKEEILEYKSKLNFVINRFMKDYGEHLDVEAERNQAYLNFIAKKSEEYSKATRMERLIKYYETL